MDRRISKECFEQFMHYVIRAVYDWFNAKRLFYFELRKPDYEFNDEYVQSLIKRSAKHSNVIQAYALLMGIDRYDVIAMCKAGLKHGYTFKEVLEKFNSSMERQHYSDGFKDLGHDWKQEFLRHCKPPIVYLRDFLK